MKNKLIPLTVAGIGLFNVMLHYRRGHKGKAAAIAIGTVIVSGVLLK